MQLVLPLETLAEKIQRRAYWEAKHGEPLGPHRRWRARLGELGGERGSLLEAAEAGRRAAAQGGQGD